MVGRFVVCVARLTIRARKFLRNDLMWQARLLAMFAFLAAWTANFAVKNIFW